MAKRDRARKEPLWRRRNTRTQRVYPHGGEYRWNRNTKAGREWESGRTVRGFGGAHLADTRDYTPLFRFLLSKVGRPWAGVHSEAVSRLESAEPIGWLVAERPEDERPYIYCGENSAWSGLKVDGRGFLVRVDPTLAPEHMEPSCPCCTHTLNGVPFGRPFPGWDRWRGDADVRSR